MQKIILNFDMNYHFNKKIPPSSSKLLQGGTVLVMLGHEPGYTFIPECLDLF